MEILIGRDADEDVLAMLVDGKRMKDSKQSVPNSVSRLKPDEYTAHCRIGIKGSKITITNLNPNNVTYVDGEPVKSAVIDNTNIVCLGVDQFRLDVRYLLKKLGYVAPVSIKHLRKVWDRYDSQLLDMQVEQQRQANQQKLQGLVSQLSMLCVIIPSVIPQVPIPPFIRVILVVAALSMGVFFYLRGGKANNSFVMKKRDLDARFRERYVCPHCGYFFGFIPYDQLEYREKCPHCAKPLES